MKLILYHLPSFFTIFNENNEIVDNTHKDKKVTDLSAEAEDSDHNENEHRNLLHEHRYIEDEILIVNNGIIHEIALGEGHIALSILDQKCEYLPFPELFSRGRFEYHYPRNINIHMSRYYSDFYQIVTKFFMHNQFCNKSIFIIRYQLQ